MPLRRRKSHTRGNCLIGLGNGSSNKECSVLLRELFEWCIFMEHRYLCEGCNSNKDEVMFVKVMAINIFSNLFSTIESFMFARPLCQIFVGLARQARRNSSERKLCLF